MMIRIFWLEARRTLRDKGNRQGSKSSGVWAVAEPLSVTLLTYCQAFQYFYTSDFALFGWVYSSTCIVNSPVCASFLSSPLLNMRFVDILFQMLHSRSHSWFSSCWREQPGSLILAQEMQICAKKPLGIRVYHMCVQLRLTWAYA